MKKRRVIIGLLTVILMFAAVLGVASSNLYISGRENISETQIEAIERQAKGVYSHRLPLIPICVSVESVEGQTVFYTIHYFPIGSVGMSYHAKDGYNIEKPLAGL